MLNEQLVKIDLTSAFEKRDQRSDKLEEKGMMQTLEQQESLKLVSSILEGKPSKDQNSLNDQSFFSEDK